MLLMALAANVGVSVALQDLFLLSLKLFLSDDPGLSQLIKMLELLVCPAQKPFERRAGCQVVDRSFRSRG